MVPNTTPRMENQMENKMENEMENEMETGIMGLGLIGVYRGILQEFGVVPCIV